MIPGRARDELETISGLERSKLGDSELPNLDRVGDEYVTTWWTAAGPWELGKSALACGSSGSRGHQRSSEVIRGHQRSSEVIRGSRGHQRS